MIKKYAMSTENAAKGWRDWRYNPCLLQKIKMQSNLAQNRKSKDALFVHNTRDKSLTVQKRRDILVASDSIL